MVTKIRNVTERNGTVLPTKILNTRNGTVTEQSGMVVWLQWHWSWLAPVNNERIFRFANGQCSIQEGGSIHAGWARTSAGYNPTQREAAPESSPQLQLSHISHDDMYNLQEIAYNIPWSIHKIITFPDLVCVIPCNVLDPWCSTMSRDARIMAVRALV